MDLNSYLLYCIFDKEALKLKLSELIDRLQGVNLNGINLADKYAIEVAIKKCNKCLMNIDCDIPVKEKEVFMLIEVSESIINNFP